MTSRSISPEGAAVPFSLRRSHEVVAGLEVTSTTETIDGLLRLEPTQLVIQWRIHRATDLVGMEIRTDQEVEPVQETSIALAGLSGAEVTGTWWAFGRRPRLILRAADLKAFEPLAGPMGLALTHPARLEVRIQPNDADAARGFAADLGLAIGDRALRLAGSDPDGRARIGPVD